MTGSRNEAYGAFAWAYDEALGKSFFATVEPLLARLLLKYPATTRTHLDLACGTGLAMSWFESKGFRSTGVDASLSMLSVARTRASRLIAGDVRQLPLRGTYARVTCLYDSLNHMLRKSDLIRSFRAVRTVLGADSLFLFDLNRPEIYSTVWQTKDPFRSRGAAYDLSIHTRYSRLTRMAFGKVSGWARMNGKDVAIDEERRQRAYSQDAVVAALRAASLEIVEVIDFDPFPPEAGLDLEAAKWLFVARPM